MSNKKLFISFIIALSAIALISSSCKKDRQGKGEIFSEPIVGNYPGLGNNGGTPSGTQFVLPSYITVVGQITGGIQYEKKMDVYDKESLLKNFKSIYDSIGGYAIYGTGTYVDIVAKFASSLDHDTTLLLPAGLIFVDESGESQNGFILQNTYIPIQAHDTAWALTKAYCLNLSRHISYDTTIYKFSVVTDNSQLLEVVNIMKTKQPPIENESGVQSALWNISDYDGLTNEDKDFLNSLP
jgi:hypothetical protein